MIYNTGDWSGNLIKTAAFLASRNIYTLGRPKYGSIRVVGLFRKALVVCMDAGITSVLSVLTQKCNHELTVIWRAWNPVKIFGAMINQAVRRYGNAIIIDTAAEGQSPDLLSAAYGEWYRKAGAIKLGDTQHCNMYEAVVVISDPFTTVSLRGSSILGFRHTG